MSDLKTRDEIVRALDPAAAPAPAPAPAAPDATAAAVVPASSPAPMPAAGGTGDDFGPGYQARREQTETANALERLRLRTGPRAASEPPAGVPGATGQPERKPAVPPVPPVPETGGLADAAGAVARDVGMGMLEAPRQIIGGMRDAWQETMESSAAVMDWIRKNVVEVPAVNVGNDLSLSIARASESLGAPDLPAVPAAKSVSGGLVRGISQFLASYVVTQRLMPGAGTTALGRAAKNAGAGSVTAATAFDPADANLANLVEQFPELSNPVTQFLATDPADGEAVNRLRNALTDAIPAALIEPFVAGVRAVRGARRMNVAAVKGDPGAASLAPDQALGDRDFLLAGDPDGPLVTVSKRPGSTHTLQPSTPEDQGLYGWRQPKGGTGVVYAIQKDGKDIGFVDLEIYPDGRARISDIVADEPLGLPVVRRLLADLRQRHPEVTSISGERVSGARKGGKHGFAGSGDEVAIALPDAPQGPLVSVSQRAAKESGENFLLSAPAADLPDRAVNINLSRLNTSDDIKAVIAKTAEVMRDEIDVARRGIQSNDQTAKLASELGMSAETLLARRSGQAFNAEEALAARQVLAASAENLAGLARQIYGGKASEADLWKFRKALALHTEIQKQVSGMTAEAGRALRAFQIPAGGSEVKVRAIRDSLANMGGEDFTRAMAAKLATLDTPEAVNAFARKVEKATTLDMVQEAWINSLLSGPQTHAVNVTSNVLVALWQVPERALASRIAMLRGAEDSVVAGEATAQLFGMIRGIREGIVLAGRTMRTGEPSDQLSKIEARTQRSITAENVGLENGGLAARAVDLLGEVFRLPGRFLMAEDEFFKAVGYRMELHAQAFRTATAEGLEGQAFAQRVQQVINDPPDNIRLAAIDAARYQTFTNPLGQAGRGVQQTINSAPALRFIMPFVRTPVNIIKFTGTRSPIGPLLPSVRADIAAGGARRDLALARVALGSMAMATTAELAAGGYVTGGGPTEPALQAAMRETGWQPYSVKVGDTWHAYNRLSPLGLTLGIAADVAEIVGQAETADGEELAAAAIMAFSQNVTNQTFLTGLADLFEVINNISPEAGVSAGERYVQRFIGSFVPTAVAQAERTIDPTLSSARTIVDQIKSRIPGYSAEVPPRRNLFGEPIVLQGGLGPDIVSPIYASTKKDSPVYDEIVRLKVPIEMPQRTIGQGEFAVEMTPQEYDRFVVLAGNEMKVNGRGLKDRLGEMVASPGWRDLTDGPDGGKALMIRAAVNAYRDAARAKVLEEFPDLMAAVSQKRRDKARAATGR